MLGNSITAAFFDLDETMINQKSLIEFYNYYLNYMGILSEVDINGLIMDKLQSGISRESLNKWFYKKYFSKIEIKLLKKLANLWVLQEISKNSFFNDSVIERLESHKNQGHICVFLTGSFREIVEPIAKVLGIHHSICAPLEERDGYYTGNLTTYPTIGIGKKYALELFSLSHNIDLISSYGYGDDFSDFNFLECVGNPVVVSSNNDALIEYAKKRNWNILNA